jgi:hypothetical protein
MSSKSIWKVFRRRDLKESSPSSFYGSPEVQFHLITTLRGHEENCQRLRQVNDALLIEVKHGRFSCHLYVADLAQKKSRDSPVEMKN